MMMDDYDDDCEVVGADDNDGDGDDDGQDEGDDHIDDHGDSDGMVKIDDYYDLGDDYLGSIAKIVTTRITNMMMANDDDVMT